MATVEVKVPDIGDFKDVPVIEVFVKPGDTVNAEDSLLTLESDKATMDVPSPAAGTVKEVKVKVGDKVSEGTLIVMLDSAAAAPSPQPSSAREPAPPQPSHPADLRPPWRHPPRLGRRWDRGRAEVRPTRAASTSNARCSCWARGPAVTALRSARPTSA